MDIQNPFLNLSETFINAIHDKSRTIGFTHTYYAYPARFSPSFARVAIETFTNVDDVVLDPFVGSGTSLVEAMALGRHAIGTDINPLARLIAEAKTTLLEDKEFEAIFHWLDKVLPMSGIGEHTRERESERGNIGYQKDVPDHLKFLIQDFLFELEDLSLSQQRLTRCALLHTGKWALDCKTQFPTVDEFKNKFTVTLEAYKPAMDELRAAIFQSTVNSKICILDVSAADLQESYWQGKIHKKPKLVVTSPPYPGVHVLYHRWQINGRKETPAPFWIAGQLDGKGASHYTMGSRGSKEDAIYFETLRKSFQRVYSLLDKDAFVVQLIAFSRLEQQFPKYLEAMRSSGFQEVNINIDGIDMPSPIWREVPSRRWYAEIQGDTSSSREVLLIHKRV